MENESKQNDTYYNRTKSDIFGSSRGKKNSNPEKRIEFQFWRAKWRGHFVNLPYYQLIEISYHPYPENEEVVMRFADCEVKVTGRKLFAIYAQITAESVGWLRESDDDKEYDEASDEPFVSSIGISRFDDSQVRLAELEVRRRVIKED